MIPHSFTIMRRLCCLCGVAITPNPSNMCVNCIRSQVDITEGIQKQVTLLWCKECERYLQPPKHWVRAALESKELLTLCIKRLKGLQKVLSALSPHHQPTIKFWRRQTSCAHSPGSGKFQLYMHAWCSCKSHCFRHTPLLIPCMAAPAGEARGRRLCMDRATLPAHQGQAHSAGRGHEWGHLTADLCGRICCGAAHVHGLHPGQHQYQRLDCLCPGVWSPTACHMLEKCRDFRRESKLGREMCSALDLLERGQAVKVVYSAGSPKSVCMQRSLGVCIAFLMHVLIDVVCAMKCAPLH